MVRISHDWIWSEWIGDLIDDYICLCCKKTKIHRVSEDKSHDWVRGHIIHDKGDPETGKKPPEIVENIRPICKDCNDKDQKYPTSYHYMVKLGTMTKDEMNKNLANIRNLLNYKVKHCSYSYCDNVVHGKAKLCRVHEKNVTPSYLYRFLLDLKVSVDRKFKRYIKYEKDPLLDDPEFLELMMEGIEAELKVLIHYNFDVGVR